MSKSIGQPLERLKDLSRASPPSTVNYSVAESILLLKPVAVLLIRLLAVQPVGLRVEVLFVGDITVAIPMATGIAGAMMMVTGITTAKMMAVVTGITMERMMAADINGGKVMMMMVSMVASMTVEMTAITAILMAAEKAAGVVVAAVVVVVAMMVVAVTKKTMAAVRIDEPRR